MSDENTLLLVDGSSYLYRAYHAMPDLRGPDGFPIGAIHGMVAMMRRLREQELGTAEPGSPQALRHHAACVFDAPGKTFRDDWYPEYKAQRAPMPDDLRTQIAPIHEVVKLLGWPVLQVPGIEADDAIGTLARVGAAAGHTVVISTGDKDLAQLVTERIALINTMTNERLDIPGVLAKFGVPPERIIDYLTLIGDTVDNVPGVAKVGPKTAVKWLAEHGSLDGVMAAAGQIKGVAGENLRAALDWLPQGRRLITVRCDCDLAEHVAGWPAIDALALQPVDEVALLDFYGRYGFRSWRKELEARLGVGAQVAVPAAGGQTDLFGAPVEAAGAAVAATGSDAGATPAAASAVAATDRAGASTLAAMPAEVGNDPALAAAWAASAAAASQPLARRYETVFTTEALAAWIARLRAAPLAALDTETDSLDPMRARIVGISFAVTPGEAAYVPMRHDYPGAPEQLSTDTVLDALRPWLEDAAAPKVGQNAKYDTHVFENHGITVRGWAHDTLLESYVLEAHLGHALDKLAERHLSRSGLTYEQLCGKGASQIPFAQVDIERAATYSGEDSEMTLQVHQVLWPRIAAEPGLRRVYADIELPVSAILQRIERKGVLIDPAVLARQSHQLAERMLQLEREAYDIAGQPFNMGSPKQIGEVLFGKLGLPVRKKTATGAPSTDEEVLQELAADYPLPARILEHRSLAKLKGTYTDKLPAMINPATGRVHTNYAQAVAVTGRLSSNDPNLQNIPIRTPEGRRVREAFIAPPGHVLVSADYSQIELRIMAHISGDPGLTRAFAEGLDVHRATAAEVFNVALDAVTPDQRRYAKTINFGLIYGMGAFGLAQSLGIEQKTAKAFIERYFDRFAGVKRYMDETRARAIETGHVETLFGRRITLPEIRSGNGPRRAGAERQAINAPMQGTAADLIKLAMIAVQDALDREGRRSAMVMQVHDELVLEVPEDELDWVREALPRLMAGVAELSVPLLAEVGVGADWDQAH